MTRTYPHRSLLSLALASILALSPSLAWALPQATAGLVASTDSQTLAVTAADVHVTYDGKPHGVKATVAGGIKDYRLRYWDEARADYALLESPTWTDATDGPQTVRFHARLGDSQEAFGQASVTIDRRPLSVSVPDADPITCDDKEHVGERTVTFSGLVPGHTATISYTPAKGTKAGTYEGSFDASTLKVTSDGVVVTANYRLAQATPGKLTIRPLYYASTIPDEGAYGAGGSGTLTFVFHRSEQDEETFAHFRGLKYGGQRLVADKHYTAKSGSVVITLLPAFLRTLPAGTHTLTAIFDDGESSVTFEVAEGASARSSRVSRSSKATSKVVRLAGTDRYGTMSEIVSEGFGTSGRAIVASGSTFADALCSSGLAGSWRCPVVLTTPGSLSPEAASQLRRLAVSDAVIVGGTNAVSTDVESALEAMGIHVERIAGASRTATSAAALQRLAAGGQMADTIVVASGSTFADALSIGPWAYASVAPVALTAADGTLTTDVLDAIHATPGVRRIVLVGGTSSVSDKVRSQLGDAYDYVRLGGADRYETSRLVAIFGTENGLAWSRPAVASGRTFPDALAGAALCGRYASPLLLADARTDTTISLARDHASQASWLYVLGGTASVSEGVEEALRSART